MYRQILWFLTEKKGYTDCYFDEDVEYDINDTNDEKIELTRCEKQTKNTEL
jgi:hypothetical protein